MPASRIIANTTAGIVIGVINIVVAVSIAALMFAGTPPEYFATGVSILLVGTLVGALGGTAGSGYGGIIVAPRTALAPVFAGQIASISALVPDPADALSTIVMTVMVTGATTGVVLLVLGRFQLGRLVRFIPYPVMGGFFAGIGLIFVRGGITVASGQTVSMANAAAFLEPRHIALTLPAVAFAALLFGARRLSRHWAVLPAGLAMAFAAFYLVLGVAGVAPSDIAAKGWLPTIADVNVRLPILDFGTIMMADWSAIVQQAGSIATITVLCAIILLLDISGIEIIVGRELDPNRELRVAGATNIVNGLTGGYPGVQVASDSLIAFTLGGESRLMGMVYAGTVALAVFAGTEFIDMVPTFILGGLIVSVGIEFLVHWTWRTAKEMPLPDYLVILLILGAITFAGILPGVAFGFFVAIVLFVIRYSRISVIKNETGGDAHSSHVDRNRKAREVLDREGGQIHIMRLQGFIFFGTADGLYETIRARLDAANGDRPIRYLVLDFDHVGEFDTSAVQVFAKLAKLSDARRVTILVSSLSGRMRPRLDSVAFFTDPQRRPAARLCFECLDDGMTWAEERILAEARADAIDDAHSGAVTTLTELLGDDIAARDIAPCFERIVMDAGSFLFIQGDRGDALYLLASGVAAVVLRLKDGKERILRVYEKGTFLGEMALYTHAPRTASVRIVEKAVLFRLSVERFRAMHENHPLASERFHSYVVRLLAERLERANRELASYQ